MIIMVYKHIYVLLLHLFISTFYCCTVPDITIQSLTDGGFRAHFQSGDSAIQRIEFRASINADIGQNDSAVFSAHIDMGNAKYGLTVFPNAQVKTGDKVYFWVTLHCNNTSDQLPGTFIIKESLSEYPEQCMESTTTMNGGKKTCVGDIIMYDDFQGLRLDTTQWIIEQWIPTYTPPKFLFNTFENSDDTLFIKNKKLYIKPIAVETTGYSTRQSLDLRSGCTSTTPEECYISSKVGNIFPSVKSAKIISKMSFQYGKVEIKAKLPAGDWIYPVIQLEQKVKENGENSPTVWLAYSRGNKNLVGNNNDDLGGCLIFGGPVLYQLEPLRSQKLASKRNSKPFYEEFHLYTFDWIPGKMLFSIDAVQYGAIDLDTFKYEIDVRHSWNSPEAPYNNEYVLSVGVAVGGIVDFPDGYISNGHHKPWLNTDENSLQKFLQQRDVWLKSWNSTNTTLQIDYVKITAV